MDTVCHYYNLLFMTLWAVKKLQSVLDYYDLGPYLAIAFTNIHFFEVLKLTITWLPTQYITTSSSYAHSLKTQ